MWSHFCHIGLVTYAPSSSAAALPKHIPNEKPVYLAYVALQNIIKGDHARTRKVETVHKFISEQQGHAKVRHLIQQHTLEGVCQATKTLLKDHIFESRWEAELRFPGVFKVPSENMTKSSMPQQAIMNANNAAAQAPLNELEKKAGTSVDTVTKDKSLVVHDPADRRQTEAETAASTLKQAAQNPAIAIQAYQTKAKAPVNTITDGEIDVGMGTSMIP